MHTWFAYPEGPVSNVFSSHPAFDEAHGPRDLRSPWRGEDEEDLRIEDFSVGSNPDEGAEYDDDVAAFFDEPGPTHTAICYFKEEEMRAPKPGIVAVSRRRFVKKLNKVIRMKSAVEVSVRKTHRLP